MDLVIRQQFGVWEVWIKRSEKAALLGSFATEQLADAYLAEVKAVVDQQAVVA